MMYAGVAVPRCECGVRCEDPARLFTAPHPATDQHCSPPHHRLRAPEYAHVVFERCVSPNPGAVHRRFITPPRRPCTCTLDAGQTVFSATVLLLLRVCISVVPLGSAFQQLPWALKADSAVLPCPCASIRYDFRNPHQCTWNSQAARRRTPLRSLRSSSLGSNEFCVDACTCEQPD